MTPAEIRAAINADPAILALVPDTQSIADALSLGRTKVGNLTAHDIRQYLMLVDLLLPIEASSSDTCKAATRALEVFPIFDMTNPMIAGKFTQVLDGLVADALIPDFTEVHKATILSLSLSDDPVSEWDVRVAIVNDDGSFL
jgi:hypothetical protein